MDYEIPPKPAFKIHVIVGAPKLSTSGNQTNLDFPIIDGSLETVEGFEPQLKSTCITGKDEAVMSHTDETLQLNVTANVQYVQYEHESPLETASIPDCAEVQPRVCDDRGTAFDKNITLRWRGSAKRVAHVLSGEFEGEIDLESVLRFEFDADNKHLPELASRNFRGKGPKVAKTKKGLCLTYMVCEVDAET